MQPKYDHEAFLRAKANLFGLLEHERRQEELERERIKASLPVPPIRWFRTISIGLAGAAIFIGSLIVLGHDADRVDPKVLGGVDARYVKRLQPPPRDTRKVDLVPSDSRP